MDDSNKINSSQSGQNNNVGLPPIPEVTPTPLSPTPAIPEMPTTTPVETPLTEVPAQPKVEESTLTPVGGELPPIVTPPVGLPPIETPTTAPATSVTVETKISASTSPKRKVNKRALAGGLIVLVLTVGAIAVARLFPSFQGQLGGKAAYECPGYCAGSASECTSNGGTVTAGYTCTGGGTCCSQGGGGTCGGNGQGCCDPFSSGGDICSGNLYCNTGTGKCQTTPPGNLCASGQTAGSTCDVYKCGNRCDAGNECTQYAGTYPCSQASLGGECGQIDWNDANGNYCGVKKQKCGGGCNPSTTPGENTNTPTSTPARACVNTRIFINGSTTAATAAQLAALKINDTIRMVVMGNSPTLVGGKFIVKKNGTDVSNGGFQVTTFLSPIQPNGAREFYYDYKITAGGTYNIEGYVSSVAPSVTATATPTGTAPTGSFSAVCTPNQKYGNLSYDLRAYNFSSGTFEVSTFFLSFVYSDDTAPIRNYLGKSTWEAATLKNGDWFGYYIYRCQSPTCAPVNGEIKFTWNSAVKIGENQRTLNELSEWTQTNKPNYTYQVLANLKYVNTPQNNGIATANVNLLPNACANPTCVGLGKVCVTGTKVATTCVAPSYQGGTDDTCGSGKVCCRVSIPNQ